MKKIKSSEINTKELQNLLDRSEESEEIDERVKDILNNVKTRGQEAVIEYTERFDGIHLDSFLVSEEEIKEAVEEAGEKIIDIFEKAAENIRVYNEKMKPKSRIEEMRDGVILGEKVTPIERVGLYVPGGTAGYPSSVLMAAVPAKVAGVPEITMVTPPGKDGKVDPYILAAASVAGIDRIYKIGGAQAIAALAYGTEEVDPVYKIVGPGNAYVASAKKQVYGTVDIDMIAGPSEIGILADDSVPVEIVAADMLSQAEHDKMAASILVTVSKDLFNTVEEELERQLKELDREEIARASIENQGLVILCDSKEEAVSLMNEIAPEHLEVLFEQPGDYLEQIHNAGAIFLGPYTPEPVGDYLAGPNHTLPTSGTAKFSSPLGVDEYMKTSSVLSYKKDAFEKIGRDVIAFAEVEGLTAHGKAVERRLNE